MKKITDKMRMDWLERHDVEINCDERSIEERFFVIGGGWAPTIRQAIDAAILAERKAHG